MSRLRHHRTTGTIAPHSGAAAAALRFRAAAWDVPLTEDAGVLSLWVWGCELRLEEVADGIRLDLSGGEKRLVDTLRDSATDLMAEAGLTVAWDRVDEGALAPGLSLARVAAVTSRSPGFVRVRLTGSDLARFGHATGIHFRLLLPPAGRAAVWPRIAATGRSVWPEGEDALHRAVYTVVDSGTAAGEDWLDFDIFHHASSPTCRWAGARPIGQTVGVIGPGGGGCPDAATVSLFGDETALPAIVRTLAASQGQVSATVRCDTADLGALARDPRVTRCDDLMAAFLADPASAAPVEGGHVWFAGPADQARAARAHLVARGFGKRDFCAAAYWG